MGIVLNLEEMASAIEAADLALSVAIERPADGSEGGWVDVRFDPARIGDAVFVDSSGMIDAVDNRMVQIPFARSKHALLSVILREIDRQLLEIASGETSDPAA